MEAKKTEIALKIASGSVAAPSPSMGVTKPAAQKAGKPKI
jgi:hypothetical protein